VSKINSSPRWQKILFSLRTRILIRFVVLMAVSAVVSILVIRHAFLIRQKKRIENSLIQEIKEFQRVVNGKKSCYWSTI
jgi:hypothetical protein